MYRYNFNTVLTNSSRLAVTHVVIPSGTRDTMVQDIKWEINYETPIIFVKSNCKNIFQICQIDGYTTRKLPDGFVMIKDLH